MAGESSTTDAEKAESPQDSASKPDPNAAQHKPTAAAAGATTDPNETAAAPRKSIEEIKAEARAYALSSNARKKKPPEWQRNLAQNAMPPRVPQTSLTSREMPPYPPYYPAYHHPYPYGSTPPAGYPPYYPPPHAPPIAKDGKPAQVPSSPPPSTTYPVPSSPPPYHHHYYPYYYPPHPHSISQPPPQSSPPWPPLPSVAAKNAQDAASQLATPKEALEEQDKNKKTTDETMNSQDHSMEDTFEERDVAMDRQIHLTAESLLQDENLDDYDRFVKGLQLFQDDDVLQLFQDDDEDEDEYNLLEEDNNDEDEDGDEEMEDSETKTTASPAENNEKVPTSSSTSKEPSGSKLSDSAVDTESLDADLYQELEEELGWLEEEEIEAAVASLLDQKTAPSTPGPSRSDTEEEGGAKKPATGKQGEGTGDAAALPPTAETPFRAKERTVVTKEQRDQLTKLLQQHYQLLVQQSVLAVRAAHYHKYHRSRTDRIDLLAGGETSDDLVEILDAAVGMVQDLDQNRKDAIRNSLLFGPKMRDHQGHHRPQQATASQQQFMNDPGSPSERRLTRAQFHRTLIEQGGEGRITVFNIKGLLKLDETFALIDRSVRRDEGDSRTDEEQLLDVESNKDACDYVLSASTESYDKSLVPGSCDLSEVFCDAREFLGPDFKPPCDDAQKYACRRNRNLFTAGEDNLVLRGVNLYGEKTWSLISDRYLPERSTNVISQRYSKLCLLLFKANGIAIDDNGFLQEPPKLEIDDIDEKEMKKFRPVTAPAVFNVHRWSLEEDITLLRAVQVTGRMWAELGARLIPHRDRGHLRKRYQVHERRIKSTVERAKKQEHMKMVEEWVSRPIKSTSASPLRSDARKTEPKTDASTTQGVLFPMTSEDMLSAVRKPASALVTDRPLVSKAVSKAVTTTKNTTESKATNETASSKETTSKAATSKAATSLAKNKETQKKEQKEKVPPPSYPYSPPPPHAAYYPPYPAYGPPWIPYGPPAEYGAYNNFHSQPPPPPYPPSTSRAAFEKLARDGPDSSKVDDDGTGWSRMSEHLKELMANGSKTEPASAEEEHRVAKAMVVDLARSPSKPKVDKQEQQREGPNHLSQDSTTTKSKKIGIIEQTTQAKESKEREESPPKKESPQATPPKHDPNVSQEEKDGKVGSTPSQDPAHRGIYATDGTEFGLSMAFQESPGQHNWPQLSNLPSPAIGNTLASFPPTSQMVGSSPSQPHPSPTAAMTPPGHSLDVSALEHLQRSGNSTASKVLFQEGSVSSALSANDLEAISGLNLMASSPALPPSGSSESSKDKKRPTKKRKDVPPGARPSLFSQVVGDAKKKKGAAAEGTKKKRKLIF